jgi:flavin reductase (DIM6/NTAB) family NADH-FMN oxidoreductase RutF
MNLDLRGPGAAVAYNLLTNIVIPRPIDWVTSRDAQGGLNLAPYSFFNLVGSDPPTVVIGIGDESPGRPKHTARNIAATRDFVVNLVTEELMKPMNITAADFPEGHNELTAAGLHETPSLKIPVPRVSEAKAALECSLHKIERIGKNNIIIGTVVALYIGDAHINDRHHVHDFHPVGRMGAPAWYARTTDLFELHRISYAQFRTTESDDNP